MRPHRPVEAVGHRDRQRAPDLHELVGRGDDQRIEGDDPVDVVAVEQRACHAGAPRGPSGRPPRRRVRVIGSVRKPTTRRAQVRERAAPGRSRGGRRPRRAGRTRRASRASARRRARRGTRRTASPGGGCARRARRPGSTSTGPRRPSAAGRPVAASDTARRRDSRSPYGPDGARVRCRAMSDWERARDARREPGASASRTSCAMRSSRRSSARPRCGSISALARALRRPTAGRRRAAPRRARRHLGARARAGRARAGRDWRDDAPGRPRHQ